MVETEQIESINFDTKVLGVYMKMDGRGYHRLRMSDFEIMWSTGLQDQNGKDIYEGDIYRLTNLSLGRFSAQERYVNDVVVFIGGQFTCSNWNIRESYGEVIGNIYEHPHLLEVSHE